MQRCCGCMREFGKEYDVCPHCGYIVDTAPKMKNHLFGGTVLSGRYMLGKVLGHGGFGITYIAWDKKLNRTVAIKEFFPNSLSTRNAGETWVSCYDDKASAFFQEGVKKMLDEGNRLSKFSNNENVVNVYDCFEENNTAYIVMEYLEGKDLKKYLEENGGKLEPEKAVEIILPVINALEDMHKENLIHRDVSPDNIFLCDNGKIKLLDFGSARLAVEDSDKSFSVMVKRGYAPKEQYASRSKQGPWTDVYAVCATLYKMITGELPVESTEREDEPLQKFSEFGIIGYDELEKVIFKGLEVEYKNRTQTVSELKKELTESAKKKSAIISDIPKKETVPASKKKINTKAIIAAVAAVVVVVGIFGIKEIKTKVDFAKAEVNGSSTSAANESNVIQSQTVKASEETIAAAMKAYEAQLAGCEDFFSAYVCDINKDGIPEVIYQPGEMGAQHMMTYTEKGGLCIEDLMGHSGMMIPDVYISEENSIFLRDDGHNQGTAHYHYAAFYTVNELGFSKTYDVFGDEWEEFDWDDTQLFEEMDAKYEKIFEEKLNKAVGQKPFTVFSNVAVSEDVEEYLNKELSVNLSEKRKEYNRKYDEFYNIIKEATSDDVLEYIFTDYDYDGTYEAFAFTGNISEETGYTGSVWFVNRNGEPEMLHTGDFWTIGETIGKKYNRFFQISAYASSASPAIIWQVVGSSCVSVLEIDGLETLNGLGYELVYPYLSDTLFAIANDYDFSVNSLSETVGSGHTHKLYYFYETPDGLAEYGGKALSLNDLKALNGYEEVHKLITENGYSVNNALFRENGIININLYKNVSQDSEYTEYNYYYINLIYVNGSLEVLTVSSEITDNYFEEYFGEGIYLPSKSAGLASYPMQKSIIK